MILLPPQYAWLSKEHAPRCLVEALKLYGTQEIKGGQHNPEILSWAHEVNKEIAAYYLSDEIPWCGLAMAVTLKRAGWNPPPGFDALRALKYATWGVFVHPRNYSIADIGVFTRRGGGHVGYLVGEDQECYHVLGGNQSDAFNIARLEKDRLHAVVRPPYKVFRPRKLPLLKPSGGISKNEA